MNHIRHLLTAFLLALLLSTSLLSNSLIHGWEGSGEGTITIGGPDAKITSFSISTGEFKSGDKIYAGVTIRNTGGVKHTFYANFSVQDPKGKWWDANYEAVTLNPNEIGTVTLYWVVDASAPPGSYNARVAVWKSKTDDMLAERLDLKEQFNAFKVTTPYQLFGYVKYMNENGKVVPLEGVLVEVRGEGKLWPDVYERTTTNNRGEYGFNNLPIQHMGEKIRYFITVSLTDKDGKYVKVLDFDGKLISIRKDVGELPDTGSKQVQTIIFSDGYERDEAIVFERALQGIKFYMERLGVTLQYIPIEIKFVKNAEINAAYIPGTKKIEIYDGLLRSPYWPRFANITVWHELTHLVVYDAFGEFPSHATDLNENGVIWKDFDKDGKFDIDIEPPEFGEMDLNHGNWKNHCTSDSLNEGIAVAMSIIISTEVEKSGEIMDYEPFRKVHLDVGLTSLASLKDEYGEEIAVAAVLWDLYDDKTVPDSKSGDEEDEDVHLAITEIWNTISKTHMLPNYYKETGYINVTIEKIIDGKVIEIKQRMKTFSWNDEKDWTNRHIYYIRDLFKVFSTYGEIFKINYIPEGFTRENRA